MPEPYYLSAYRFRIVYGLNDDALTTLIRTAYFQKGADIYALWTRARESFWNYTLGPEDILEPIFKTPFPEIPEFISPFPIHIAAEHVLFYMVMLSQKISIEAVQLGLDEVIKTAYAPYVLEQPKAYGLLLRYISKPKRKYRLEKTIQLSVGSLSLPISLYSFFQEIFCNAVVLDMNICASILEANGHPRTDALGKPYIPSLKIVQNAPPLSEQNIENTSIPVQLEMGSQGSNTLATNRKIAECSSAQQAISQLVEDLPAPKPETRPYSLPHPIPKILWERMSQAKIISNMREQGCPDEEIAYVLRVEKALPRKEVGRLLYAGKGEVDSTFYRHWKKLYTAGIKMGIPFPPEKRKRTNKKAKK